MLKEAIKKLKPYIPEQTIEEIKREQGLTKLVRLSANENAWGTSPKVAQAILDWGVQDANRYPDSELTGLRNAIAQGLKVKPETLVFGDGLDEIIQLLSRTLLSPADEVVLTQPTFSEYALHAEIEGAKLVNVPVDTDGLTDLKEMLAAITPATAMVWLCNPNNPTGTYVTHQAIATFMDQVPKSVTVVVDEAYIDFVTDEKQASVVDLLQKFDNLVVLRTFSKAYGLANFRVGYAVVAPQLAKILQTVRLPYNLSTFAEIAAEAAYADQSFVADVVDAVAKERHKWLSFLQKLKVQYYPSQANFIFFKITDAAKLSQELLQNGYLVRTGLGPDWLRITVGQPTDNQVVQNLIRAFIEQ
ncbi:histidinol-phosphate transaminase [Lactobacillus sp. LC28-10]|uniref:Histidinol-phosphate aminotransferase n=1 Tax=Secundilactobacillus angelensis TaxID=2722706 RepID=A0ABX1KY30_9LACO|nr:histidinol-phosphate transaminase [Secundilactobacillus angelensis]MCH5462473.1 histidinol-phosphate transaminase [Secundilactobacillus angelensis]NLR18045.1 histidinol-phosphate transaminase [Secundilactobacillus angelensis]